MLLFDATSRTYIQFPEITLWLSIYKLTKTTSIQSASLKSEKIEHENIYQPADACSISRLIPGAWSHILYVCVCVCVWESRWILFTLEESEMPGSPILKLTGPFGSNHQMCHGKNAMSWCKGRQDFASINIFLRGWQWISVWLGFMHIKRLSASLRVVFPRVCLSFFPLAHLHDPKCNAIDKQGQKRGRVLSASPPPDRKFR